MPSMCEMAQMRGHNRTQSEHRYSHTGRDTTQLFLLIKHQDELAIELIFDKFVNEEGILCRKELDVVRMLNTVVHSVAPGHVEVAIGEHFYPSV